MKQNTSRVSAPYFVFALTIALSVVQMFSSVSSAKGQNITTIAGSGTAGFSGDNGPATAAKLFQPLDALPDNAGNIYFIDGSNHRIRKISSTGIVTTIAGDDTASFTGDGGPASAARLINPRCLAFDKKGNLYISDYIGCRIRKIDTAGIISTFAGVGTIGFSGDNGPATAAQIFRPIGIATDKHDNVYIADSKNSRIRKVDTFGIITTIAGDGSTGVSGDNGPATAAGIYEPRGISIDTLGNIYFAEPESVRMINLAGIITTVAGQNIPGSSGDGGPATAALLSCMGVRVDNSGNLYLTDVNNHKIRKINSSGIISTIAGTGTQGYNGDSISATVAQLHSPKSIAIDNAGNLYIADQDNDRIRKISNNAIGLGISSAPHITTSIFPNPSSGQFSIITASANQENVYYFITDMMGKEIGRCSAATNTKTNITLTVPPGIYTLTISSFNKTTTEKLVIL